MVKNGHQDAKERKPKSGKFVLRATLLGVGGIAAGLMAVSANTPEGAFEQAYEACVRPLERPSTIESERALQSEIQEDLTANGWRILDPYQPTDFATATGLFGVSSELIRVAVQGDTYGAQYNGAQPHEYWAVVQGYLPPSAYKTDDPNDTNIRNKWLISQDQTALLVFGAGGMTYCTLHISDAGFDRTVLSDTPATPLEQLGDVTYEYHRNSEAEFDGGVSSAAMIEGTQFEAVLQTEIPSVWDITIHRPWE